jgi:hypothetical protein
MKIQHKIEETFEIKPSVYTSTDVEEMIDALPRLVTRDAKKTLGKLMLYFADEKDSLLPYTSSGDRVIFFLDGNCLGVNDPQSIFITKNILCDFSSSESMIIMRWLKEIARTRFSKLCPDDVESAIKYWADRAGADPEG